jgi:hypothetical protein
MDIYFLPWNSPMSSCTENHFIFKAGIIFYRSNNHRDLLLTLSPATNSAIFSSFIDIRSYLQSWPDQMRHSAGSSGCNFLSRTLPTTRFLSVLSRCSICEGGSFSTVVEWNRFLGAFVIDWRFKKSFVSQTRTKTTCNYFSKHKLSLCDQTT